MDTTNIEPGVRVAFRTDAGDKEGWVVQSSKAGYLVHGYKVDIACNIASVKSRDIRAVSQLVGYCNEHGKALVRTGRTFRSTTKVMYFAGCPSAGCTVGRWETVGGMEGGRPSTPASEEVRAARRALFDCIKTLPIGLQHWTAERIEETGCGAGIGRFNKQEALELRVGIYERLDGILGGGEVLSGSDIIANGDLLVLDDGQTMYVPSYMQGKSVGMVRAVLGDNEAVITARKVRNVVRPDPSANPYARLGPGNNFSTSQSPSVSDIVRTMQEAQEIIGRNTQESGRVARVAWLATPQNWPTGPEPNKVKPEPRKIRHIELDE